MEKVVKLVSISPLKEREYEDKNSHELRKLHWAELEFTDGLDTFIAELPVRGINENGKIVFRQPDYQEGRIYKIAVEISCSSGNRDGRDWYSNKFVIRKIATI